MNLYLILKALHLIAMVAWFAGLFYLPRLFVYHVANPKMAPVFGAMEYKLSRFIMLPAAVATWVFGVALLSTVPEALTQGWLHAKLGLVLLLTAYHASLEWHRMNLAAGKNTFSQRFYRLYNEVPTVLLILIVGLAILKPF